MPADDGPDENNRDVIKRLQGGVKIHKQSQLLEAIYDEVLNG